MEEFDFEEYRERMQTPMSREAFQKMLKDMEKAMEGLSKAIAIVGEKIVEVFSNTDWDAIAKVLMEGEKENVLEDYIRSRQRKRVRDAHRHRRGGRPAGCCRDWRRSELPTQKSYVRRWKLREARMRRDFRRRRT